MHSPPLPMVQPVHMGMYVPPQLPTNQRMGIGIPPSHFMVQPMINQIGACLNPYVPVPCHPMSYIMLDQ